MRPDVDFLCPCTCPHINTHTRLCVHVCIPPDTCIKRGRGKHPHVAHLPLCSVCVCTTFLPVDPLTDGIPGLTFLFRWFCICLFLAVLGFLMSLAVLTDLALCFQCLHFGLLIHLSGTSEHLLEQLTLSGVSWKSGPTALPAVVVLFLIANIDMDSRDH